MNNVKKAINKQAVINQLHQAVIHYKNDDKKMLGMFKWIAIFIDIDAPNIDTSNEEQINNYIDYKIKEYKEILNI